MSKPVTNNATMQCSLGTTPSQIKVTSQSFSVIEGELIATENDKQSMVNIPTFGNCKCVWYHPACIPKPENWVNTAETNTVNGMAKLTLQSQCSCTKGGTISFIDTGVNLHDDIK